MLPIKSDLAYAIIFKPKSLIKTLQTKDSKTVGIFHNILRHKFFGRCLLTPKQGRILSDRFLFPCLF